MLVDRGFTTLEAFEGAEAHDLVNVGFDEAEAAKIIEAVRQHQAQ